MTPNPEPSRPFAEDQSRIPPPRVAFHGLLRRFARASYFLAVLLVDVLASTALGLALAPALWAARPLAAWMREAPGAAAAPRHGHERRAVLLPRGPGFPDATAIAYHTRPRLFDLHTRLPDPLYAAVVEADERVTAEGEALRALDEAKLDADLRSLRSRGIESVAIVFLHGSRHPDHERRAAALARGLGFAEVNASHEVSRLIRFVSRGHTTVVDAYLTPLLGRYVRAFRAGLGERHSEAQLEFMQSNGGLVGPEGFRACNAVLSAGH